jgi:hypothetical protein
MKRYKFILFFTILGLLSIVACTDLEENVLDEQLGENLINDPDNVEALINPPYASLRHLIEWYDFWGLEQITTDETAFPTRGSDWYDNGAWQKLHLQTWTPDHSRLGNVWDALSQGISRANTAIYYIGQFDQTETTELYIYEARFLRALFMYHMADLYGQVPFREADELDFSVTPEVKDRGTAINFIISEINEIIPNLKSRSDLSSERVTVGAAYALLAKIYLNYEAYTGETKWDEAITYCDKIIDSGEYEVTDDYWSMFQWDVESHPEFILTVPMSDQVDMGSGSIWIEFTLHYNQVFGNYTSFWNGGCTTSTFLDTWDQENDIRFYDDRIKNETGINQGFLIGQQDSVGSGTPLTDRYGSLLIFTPEFDLTNSDESAGVRVVKFAPNPETLYAGSYAPNDYPLFRISEIYLARAEAKFRKGNESGALEDINYIRGKRSAEGKTLPLLTSLTLNDILKERGFELYWEGYRRQDLIRFDKFDDAWQEKPVSEESKALFAIPTSALDVNENLTQNSGY